MLVSCTTQERFTSPFSQLDKTRVLNRVKCFTGKSSGLRCFIYYCLRSDCSQNNVKKCAFNDLVKD